MPKYNLQFLDMRLIKDGSVVVIIGKKNTGKTTVMLDVCYHKRHIPDCVVFSGTRESNDSFDGIVPETFIYNEYRPDKVAQVIRRQARINKERKKKGLPKKFTAVIVDDCAYDDNFCKDPQLKQLIFNGRHDGIFFIFTMHYALNMAPPQRGNIDWLFILREVIPDNRERLYKSFCGQLGTRKEFNAVMDKVTDNYGALVVRNTGTSNRIEDTFFWYRAKLRNFKEHKGIRPWRMGSKAYWAMHYERYNKHWDSDGEVDGDDDEDLPIVPVRGRGRGRGRGRNVVRMLPPPASASRRGRTR